MINFTRAMVSGLPRCFGAVVWFACAMPVCAADAPVVIQHGTVFDSVAGKLLAERTILIEAAPPIHRDIGLPISDPGRVPAIVADMVAWHVTTLKIYAGSSRSVGRKIIEEGHKHGLIVTGHLSNYPAQEAVEDGIDCLEHITSVFDFIIPLDVRKKAGHRAWLDIG